MPNYLLTQFNIEVDRNLQGVEASEVSSDDRDAKTSEALLDFSRQRAQEIITEITGDGTSFYPISYSGSPTMWWPYWEDGFSVVSKVEYPAADIAADDDPRELYRYEWNDNFWGPNLEVRKPTVAQDVTGWTSVARCYDQTGMPGEDRTFGYETLAATASPAIRFHTWAAATRFYEECHLYLTYRTDGNFVADQFQIEYTKDGGVSWDDLLALGVHRETGLTEVTAELDLGQDLSLVEVRVNFNLVTTDGAQLYIYDVWTEGDYTIGQTYQARYLYLPYHSPGGTETIRATYTVPYLFSGSPSGVDITNIGFRAVCNKAASLCCDLLATRYGQTTRSTYDIESINYLTKAEEYRRMAADFQTTYERLMGIPRLKRARASALVRRLPVKSSLHSARGTLFHDY